MGWEQEFENQLKAISPHCMDMLRPPPTIMDATLCGVLVEAKPIKRSNWGRRDYSAVVGIKDPTGYIRVNLFHADHAELPQAKNVAVGDVLLIKHVKVSIFNHSRQGVSLPTTVNVLVRKGQPVESLKQPWITDNDRQVIAILQSWWNTKEVKESNISKIQPTLGRSLVEVRTLTETAKYFDIVLQVIIKVEQQKSNRLIAYFTDYTMNPQPPLGFLETGMAESVDAHLVILGAFWDNQANLMSQIQSGEIIKIRNAVKSISPNNELEFNLRGSRDTRPHINRLSDDDPDIQALLRRKDEYEQNKRNQIALTQSASQMSQRITSYPSLPQQQQQQQPYYQSTASTINTLTSAYAPTPAYTPFSWQAVPQQAMDDDAMDVDTIATEVTTTYSYKTIEEQFKEVAGTRSFVKASIIDFKPREFEDWIRKLCPICHETTKIDYLHCPKCTTPIELEMILKFALKIQDTANHKMIVGCFGQEAVKLFPGIDLNNVGSAVETIKGFIDQACPIVTEKQMFLDFGIESYDMNGGRCYQVVDTKFIKTA